jgi:uncharacterized protein YbcV (DUF1398 family)
MLDRVAFVTFTYVFNRIVEDASQSNMQAPFYMACEKSAKTIAILYIRTFGASLLVKQSNTVPNA